MSKKCQFCGRWPGFFAREHSTCRERDERERDEARRAAGVEAVQRAKRAHEEEMATAQGKVTQAMRDAMAERTSFELAGERVFGALDLAAIDDAEKRHLLIAAWEATAGDVIATGEVTEAQNTLMAKLMHRFGLSEADADRTGVLSRVVQIKLLRDLSAGRKPQYIWMDDDFPVVLRKDEHALWLFRHAVWYEPRVGTVWHPTEGAAPGMQRFLIDKGILLVTSRALQFVGPVRSLQIPFKKIAAMRQDEDHLVISRTLATAKAVSFLLGIENVEWGLKLLRAAIKADE
jgi:hypothetical protein